MEDMCVREVKTLCWEKTQSSWKVGNKKWLQKIDVRVVYVKLYRILHSPVLRRMFRYVCYVVWVKIYVVCVEVYVA